MGLLNYSSTSATVYDLLNPHFTVKAYSVEGEGKDGVDGNNARSQSILKQARAIDDVTCKTEYIRPCQARRPPGDLNVSLETNREHEMTAEEKKSVKPFDDCSDMKLRARGPQRYSLLMWELFSRRNSERTGKAVGYGRGRYVSEATLISKHGLKAHRLPSDSAVLSFVETDALQDGQNARHNPVGVLSREQKRSAAIIAETVKSARMADKKAARTQADTKRAAWHNNQVWKCDRCNAKFKSEVWYAKHRANDCGRYAARVQRRRVHDAGTIRALVKQYDDDLADEVQSARRFLSSLY